MKCSCKLLVTDALDFVLYIHCEIIKIAALELLPRRHLHGKRLLRQQSTVPLTFPKQQQACRKQP